MGNGPEFDLCVVVDDDDDILLAARLLLRRLFIDVVTVRTPEEAMTAIGSRLPDVMLLDANFARGATDAREGLFPEPRELALDCSCPDSAEVCKHVAAVLYGIAVRLDARPELFFDLRQVDQAELFSSATAGAGIVRSPSAAGKRIAADRLSSVFGIDLETAPSATRRPRRRAAPARKSP